MYATDNQPKIRVLPEAAQHIAHHGGHAFIRPSPRHGCCGGTAFLPVIDVGSPSTRADYQAIEQEGITVHLHKELDPSESLTIGANGIWKWQKLWVDGFRISM